MELMPTLASLILGLAIALLGYSMARIYFMMPVTELESQKDSELNPVRLLTTPLASFFRAYGGRYGFVRENTRNYDDLLSAAGSFWGGLDACDILAARFVFPPLFALLLLLLGELAGLALDYILLAVLLFAALSFMLPESALRAQAKKRQALFLKQLPGGLDILKIAAESGLDFHSSVNYMIQIYVPGPVRDEMRRFQQEMRLGISTVDGLLNVSRRIDVPEVSTVFTSLAQATEMGTSISEMLAETSSDMRRKRLLSAETEAQKAVVKITFPLLLLILPGIFIVLLAPIVKPMMQALQGF